jgi:hypothetical protein
MERAYIPQPNLFPKERVVVVVCFAFLGVVMWTAASHGGHINLEGKYH